MKVRDIIGDHSKWMPSLDYDASEPEVSVLLPTFRRAKSGLFEAAVQSVLNQDFKNLELIIIDDASTDGTADLIAHFMKNDPRVSCIRHEYNIGLPAISEYEGYMKARGAYIAFIFDDNEWERDYLSRTINFMVRKQAKAAYGRVRSYYGDGQQYMDLGVSNSEIGAHTLLATNHIANGGVVLTRDTIETVGLYDPHVAMTRLCDWNLWKRIAARCEFFETGILAGIERGAALNDSLGNSYKMNSWITAEREAFQSPGEFLPENYPNIEIDGISPKNTQSYLDAILFFYKIFSQKNWYRECAVSIRSTKTTFRVLVIATHYEATTELAFERLFGRRGNLVFKFARRDVPIHEILQADAVILMRNLPVLNHFKGICKRLQIPCYYYLDDNFITLAKDFSDNYEIQKLAAYLTAVNLQDFSAVFVSTQTLKNYFYKTKLHDHVYLLDPVMEYEEELKCKEWQLAEGPLVCAYMGAAFRDSTLTRTVLPALIMLSKRWPIRLICPDRVKFDKRYANFPNFEIIQIPFSLSLGQALQRYKAFRPAYLLHCGPDIQNNTYKTENALINAVEMGAVLISSKTEQYETVAQKGFCLCVENQPDEWCAVLERLTEEPAAAEKIYRDAKEYCTARYSRENAEKTLKKAFESHGCSRYFEVIERYNAVVFDIVYNGAAMLKADPALDDETGLRSRNRSLTEVPLIYSGGIQRARNYRIICNVSTLSRLGICFASLGIPAGQVKVKLSTERRTLREVTLNLFDYIRDNWTYLSFDPIENALNLELTVSLEFEYEEGSDLVGVFEDGTKRSFLYRLSNKLGHPIAIRNLLYVDCQ